MTPQAFTLDPPVLPDGGIGLRRATVADAEAVFAYRGLAECQAYVSQTLSTVEDTQAMLEKRLGNPDVVMWAIEQDGRIVGDIGGYRYRPESLGSEPEMWDFYLGYVLHPDVWNRGIASQVVGAVVPRLHDAGIRRVVAKVLGPNEASVRVLVKNGFEHEGTERAAVVGRDGSWLDDHALVHWR